MIVLNEAPSIEKTLLSCKPFIDRWLIVDTGSTDGTQEIIERTLRDIPGRLLSRPFVDFATTRNVALAEETEATFVLMLSGDETLVGGGALRAFCVAHEKHTDGAYDCTIAMGSICYQSPRLTRVSAGWRYTGVTHEVLQHPDGVTVAAIGVKACHILHKKRGSAHERWIADEKLLKAEWERNPTPRTAFYLAQTYECLGNLPEALRRYEIRIKLGGWHEELFEARLRAARIRLSIVPHIGVIELLEVHSIAPHRAEPLYDIGLHYYRAGMRAVGLVFAQRAAQIPYPANDRLFVTESIYRWQAWDLVACCAGEDRHLGLDAARKALAGNPADKRLETNVENCAQLVFELG